MAGKSSTVEQTSMSERLDAQGARGWNPTPGATLEGVVTDIKASMPNEFGIYPIVTVKDDATDKLVAVHCFHSVLKNRMLEQRPAAGERIAIRYEGEFESKNSKAGKRDPYHGYSVVVDRPETEAQAASWDSFASTDSESE